MKHSDSFLICYFQRRYRILRCNWSHSGEEKVLEKKCAKETSSIKHEKSQQVKLIIRRCKDAIMYL